MGSHFLFCNIQVGSQTFLGQILKLVESANSQKSPTQLFADQLASWFIPAILIFAFITCIIWTLFVVFEVVVPKFLSHVDGDSTSESIKSHDWGSNILNRVIFITQFPIAVIAVACPCALGEMESTCMQLVHCFNHFSQAWPCQPRWHSQLDVRLVLVF